MQTYGSSGDVFNSNVTKPSNYRSIKKLDQWLKKRKIVGKILKVYLRL